MSAPCRVLIVEARFYADIADALVLGAERVLGEAGVAFERIAVPGAFEIPGAIRFAIEGGRFHGFVALGCVIRGETSHYDYVCAESARGLATLALDQMAAIGYGILTCETRAQAEARAAVDGRDKGGEAARACLEMIAIKKSFGIAWP